MVEVDEIVDVALILSALYMPQFLTHVVLEFTIIGGRQWTDAVRFGSVARAYGFGFLHFVDILERDFGTLFARYELLVIQCSSSVELLRAVIAVVHVLLDAKDLVPVDVYGVEVVLSFGQLTSVHLHDLGFLDRRVREWLENVSEVALYQLSLLDDLIRRDLRVEHELKRLRRLTAGLLQGVGHK